MAIPLRIPGVVPAAELRQPAWAMVSSGVAALDALTGGLPRGALTEICGPASSGRTSLLLAALAERTAAQELCALVDADDSFDPHSAAAAGVDLDRLLWVRCGAASGHGLTQINTDKNSEIKIAQDPNTELASGNVRQRIRTEQIPNPKSQIPNRSRAQIKIQNSKFKNVWFARLEQALKATDLLLQGGGFGMVAVDLAGVPPEVARRVPLASWFRFRRAVEHTPTVLLALEQEPFAKSCAALVLRTSTRLEVRELGAPHLPGVGRCGSQTPPHAQLFPGLTVEVELVRWRLESAKKSAQSAARFETRAQWAG